MKKKLLRLVSLAALSALVALVTLAWPAISRTQARVQQTESPPRKQRTPAASPVIKLPRGQTDGAETQEGRGETEASEKPAARRWEYCAILSTEMRRRDYSSTAMGYAFIKYFGGGSEEIEAANEDEAFYKALAKLGEEGWELAAVRERINLSDGYGSSTGVFYFKRQK